MTRTTKKGPGGGIQAQPGTLREAAQSVKDKAGKPRDRDYTLEYARRSARAMAKKRGADPHKAAEKAGEIVKAGEKSGAKAAKMAVEDQLPLFQGKQSRHVPGTPSLSETIKPQPERPSASEEPKVSPIAPEQIASLIESVINPICNRVGVDKLSKAELADGGKAWAPVFDHYFPLWAAKTGPWLLAGLWTVQIGGARAIQYADRKSVEKEEARLRGDFRGSPDPNLDSSVDASMEEVGDRVPAHQVGQVAS